MANRTIGGNQNLDSMSIDHYKVQQEQQSLAIWDYDESINHTRRISPKNLIDNSDTVVELGQKIDNIKKDLGGDPYIAFSTAWGKETENKYPSIYENLTDYTYPTSAEKEIRYIEADIKDLKDNFNDQIESLKKDLGYDPNATEEAASTYHSINGDNENPNYQSAYHWLSSLEEKVVTSNYPTEPSYKTNIYNWLNYLDTHIGWNKNISEYTGSNPKTDLYNNAHQWLQKIQVNLDDIQGNFARKYWTRYWADELRHSHDILPEPYTANYPRKDYEKDISSENQKRIYYYFGLQNDGNLVLYRSKNNTQGDGPADIGNNRQWVWQTGPEYKPAIFRIKGYFDLGKDAYTASTIKSFDITDAINIASTINSSTGLIALAPSYFEDNDNTNKNYFSILSVKKPLNTTVKTCIKNSTDANAELKSLNINYLKNTIDVTLVKNAQSAVTVDGTTYTTPAYLYLDMIIARDSNIANPQNYPNT